MLTHTPNNSILESLMKPQVDKAIQLAMIHFRARHDGRGFRPCRQWILEARQICISSGYRNPSICKGRA
jgi:hypothetical protein